MKLRNKTDSTQQICDIGGTAYTALPGQIIEVNEKCIYPYEVKRAMNFFDLIEQKTEFKSEFKKKKEEEQGGKK